MDKLTFFPVPLKKTLNRPEVLPIALNQLRQWTIGEDLNITHSSGHFFSLIGMENKRSGSARILINQPEIGLLYTEIRRNGDRINIDSEVSCSVKFEPGNYPFYQLSPTIQKTYSNMQGLHGGKRLREDQIDKIIGSADLSLLLTEQSGSFLHKKNLNVIGCMEQHIESESKDNEYFVVLKLQELLKCFLSDRVVHIDLRSCMCAPLVRLLIEEYCNTSSRQVDIIGLVERISIYSSLNQSRWTTAPVSAVASYDEGCISIRDRGRNGEYKVIGVRTTTVGREVASWDQPLLVCPSEDYHIFFSHDSTSIAVLVSIYTGGAGSLSEGELAPVSEAFGLNEQEVAFLLSCSREVHRSTQTEEGGRFYHRSNRHFLHQVDPDEMQRLACIKESLCWVNIDEILSMLLTTQLVSIELRSAMCILAAFILTKR